MARDCTGQRGGGGAAAMGVRQRVGCGGARHGRQENVGGHVVLRLCLAAALIAKELTMS